MGALLVLAGMAFVAGKRVLFAGTVLGAFLFLYFLFLYVPRLVANVHDPAPWTSGAEILALCGAALALAGASSGRFSSLARLGSSLFALTLTVFGIQHLLYGRFVATLIPAWIPGRLFFAYGVGLCFIATTLSILSGLMDRLAATLLGTMFLTWVVILHLPRVLASQKNGNEWTSAIVALAMAGGSWIVAGAVRKISH